MVLETRICGPRSLKVILERSGSLGAYNRIHFQNFFIFEVPISSEIDDY
jgi:hypothetical protein